MGSFLEDKKEKKKSFVVVRGETQVETRFGTDTRTHRGVDQTSQMN